MGDDIALAGGGGGGFGGEPAGAVGGFVARIHRLPLDVGLLLQRLIDNGERVDHARHLVGAAAQRSLLRRVERHADEQGADDAAVGEDRLVDRDVSAPEDLGFAVKGAALSEQPVVDRPRREPRADGARARLVFDIGRHTHVAAKDGGDAAETMADVVDDPGLVVDELVAEIEPVAVLPRRPAPRQRVAQRGEIGVEPGLRIGRAGADRHLGRQPRKLVGDRGDRPRHAAPQREIGAREAKTQGHEDARNREQRAPRLARHLRLDRRHVSVGFRHDVVDDRAMGRIVAGQPRERGVERRAVAQGGGRQEAVVEFAPERLGLAAGGVDDFSFEIARQRAGAPIGAARGKIRAQCGEPGLVLVERTHAAVNQIGLQIGLDHIFRRRQNVAEQVLAGDDARIGGAADAGALERCLRDEARQRQARDKRQAPCGEQPAHGEPGEDCGLRSQSAPSPR